MTSNMDGSKSTFFFPLRTNVGFFDAPEGSLSLITRIKQAALLYDHLIFEAGMYEATIMSHAFTQFWHPPTSLSDSILENVQRTFSPTGGESNFIIQAAGGHPVRLGSLSGPVERRLYSQFHSTLKELQADALPWIEMINLDLQPDGERFADSIKRDMINLLDYALPTENQRLKKLIASNLGDDLTKSIALQSVASIDLMYAPIFLQRAYISEGQGFRSLSILVPDLSHLSWSDIVEMREYDSMKEFRALLLSVESTARKSLFDNDYNELQHQINIYRAFTAELIRELIAARKTKGDALGSLAIDLMVGLCPVSGVGTAMNILRELHELSQTERSWLTAFLRLRGESPRNWIV